MTLNRTLLVSLVSLLCAFGPSLYAQEELTDFKEDSLPVLNEELRKIDYRLNKLEQWSGQLSFSSQGISAGVLTVHQGSVSVDTETGAASDNLDTIDGGVEGNVLVLKAESSARTVVVKDGTGNLKLSGDMTLDNSEDSITLKKVGLNWVELARSNNGA